MNRTERLCLLRSEKFGHETEVRELFKKHCYNTLTHSDYVEFEIAFNSLMNIFNEIENSLEGK